MNWVDKFSRIDECVTIGKSKIRRLLFADDLVLLASSESGLQHALINFAASCDIATLLKISSSKTKVLNILRNPVQCFLQVGGVSLRQGEMFKYLGASLRMMKVKTKKNMFD